MLLQSFKCNSASSTVVVCPIIPAASASEEFGSVVFSHENSDYVVMVSNPITVQVNQLTTFLYRLDNSIVSEINKSLRLVFGIQPMQVIKADRILQELQVAKQEIINAVISSPTSQNFSSSSEVCQEDSSGIESDCIISEEENSSPETFASSTHTNSTLSSKTEPVSSTQASVIPEVDEELMTLAKYLAGETEEPSGEIEKPPKEQEKPASGIRIRWTDDKIDQFLKDCDTLSSHAVAEKWDMTIRTISMNKSRLKKIRQKGK